MPDRSQQMQRWLTGLGYADFQLSPASEDASFRSYWRLEGSSGTYIVMDAPPDMESCDGFIQIAEKLRRADLNAPEVIARNLDQGFLLLTDFGNHSYLSQLDQVSMRSLYADAIDALHRMQLQIDVTGLRSRLWSKCRIILKVWGP